MDKHSLAGAVLLMSLLLSLTACNRSDGYIDYVPFQETEDGQWGMIAPDGKVLFTDEFKERPTVATSGRFFVQNKQGIWEMYNTKEKPEKVGKDYAHASCFVGGRAVVAEKDKPVSIIDTDGKTVALLDKVDGKEVLKVQAINEGYAVYMTTDSLYGAVDDGGKAAVPAQYISLSECGDGKFFAIDKKYKRDAQAGKTDKVKISIIDTSGKELFTIGGDKYESSTSGFVDGKLGVSVKKNGEEQWGIIDDKGEYLLRPSAKIKRIGQILGDLFTYYNGEGWGLMNLKGETLIRAKYDALWLNDPHTLLAYTKDGDDDVYKYVNEKDEPLSQDTYTDATSFALLDGQHALVKPDDKLWAIIDRKGKVMEKLPDMVNISLYTGDTWVESDFVDMQAFISKLQITPKGALGLTLSSTPQQVVAMQVKEGGAVSTADHKAGTPYWYDTAEAIGFQRTAGSISGVVNVEFPTTLSRQTYRTQRVIDDYSWDYSYYWYHDEQVPTGYVWNATHPQYFSLQVDNEGRMHGKLLKALIAKFQTMGKIAKQNDGAAVLTLNGGTRALVFMDPTRVVAMWGDIAQVNDIDISRYEDVSEDGENTPATDLEDFADSTAVDDYAPADTAVAVY